MSNCETCQKYANRHLCDECLEKRMRFCERAGIDDVLHKLKSDKLIKEVADKLPPIFNVRMVLEKASESAGKERTDAFSGHDLPQSAKTGLVGGAPACSAPEKPIKDKILEYLSGKEAFSSDLMEIATDLSLDIGEVNTILRELENERKVSSGMKKVLNGGKNNDLNYFERVYSYISKPEKPKKVKPSHNCRANEKKRIEKLAR